VLLVSVQELIQKSADRLSLLAGKWEEIRGPLMTRYRSLQSDSENKESEATKLLEEIKLMRERMKELADETRLKDNLYKQLVSATHLFSSYSIIMLFNTCTHVQQLCFRLV